MKKVIALLSFFMLTSSILLVQDGWQPITDKGVYFTIDGLFGVDVKGTVSGLKATIHFDPEDFSKSTMDVLVNPSTVNTKNKKRDQHLKTSDFFNVEKFISIHFVSKNFRQVGEYYVVEGALTLKDVTKPITIPFEFINKGDSAIFRGDFNINRLDYHLGEKSAMMGNEVRIHLDVPVKQIHL